MRQIALSLVAFIIPFACTAIEPTIPQLSLRGDATLSMPADQMELTIGVVTQDKDSNKAVQDNSDKMRKVIDALKAIGLTGEDFHTGSFHIQPIYKYPQNEAPKLVNYEVTNSIKIKTSKLDLADKIIGGATEAGSNKIEQISFNLKNPQAYRELAIQQAAENALSDAKVIALATHVEIVRVLSITLDANQNHYPRPVVFAKMATNGNASEVPIEAGDVQVTAGLNITFEIR